MSAPRRFARWLAQAVTLASSVALSCAAFDACAGRVVRSAHNLPTPPPYQEPPLVRSHNGVAKLFLAALNSDDGVPEIYYAPHGYVAPTIEVEPGDTIDLRYQNLLARMRVPFAQGHDITTNLHFHGLTTSPKPPSDDAIDVLYRRESTDYVVKVNRAQPPGLYWYHPHPHAESAWQVGNGMSGALVVDGIQDDVPDVAGLRQRLLIVRQAVSEDEQTERATLGRRFCGLQRMSPAQRAAFLHRAGLPNPSPKASVESSALTVNQLKAGSLTIGIAPGERELFRVLNATGDRNLVLSVGSEPFELVAEDGVPLGVYPGSPRSRLVQNVLVPPGGRAEFVVTGARETAVLRTAAYDTGPKGDRNPAADLATLVDDGGGASTDSRIPPAAAGSQRTGGFYAKTPPPPVLSRVVRLEEKADGTDFRINGASYDPDAAPMFTARAGTVERWTLLNTTDEVHDFHTHQVHFVVESIDGVAVPAAQRHWNDEVNVPYQHHGRNGHTTPGKVVILVDFRDPVIRGDFLFHCHILDHEDGGMMATIRVI